jgi:glycerol-3-phosphate acyltransferase PlsY
VFNLAYIVVAIVGYFLGSIPTGFLVAKARGIDIRSVGSGNIGAANTFRAIGKGAGIFVLLIDALKGLVAVELCGLILRGLGITATGAELLHYQIVAGIFAVLGHNYTCWLKFKGGKGVATTAGVYLALAPAALGIAVVVFILTVAIVRITSLGSMLAAVTLMIAVWFTQPDMALRLVTIALCALTILKHRTNIQRLMAGKENRIEFRKKPPQS